MGHMTRGSKRRSARAPASSTWPTAGAGAARASAATAGPPPVLTRRHAQGHATVFGPGIDEMELKLAGMSNGKIAQCSGTTDAAPGVAFEATLILNEDQPPAPGAVSPVAKVRGRNKLPK